LTSLPHDRHTVLPAATGPADRQGDESAVGRGVERVITQFGALLSRIARSRGIAPADVDDVLQDVRIRLWKSQGTAENIAALSTSYLVKVASSAAIDVLRQRRRDAGESLDQRSAEGMVPEALQVAAVDHDQNAALAHRLDQALRALARNRRLVVQLHLDGYERHEIAAITTYSDAKVRNLLYRGLDDLRAHLRGNGEETRA